MGSQTFIVAADNIPDFAIEFKDDLSGDLVENFGVPASKRALHLGRLGCSLAVLSSTQVLSLVVRGYLKHPDRIFIFISLLWLRVVPISCGRRALMLP